MNLYRLSNGKVVDKNGLVEITRYSKAHLQRLMRVYGVYSPRLFAKVKKRFDRTKTCFQSGVQCRRYTECQDARLFGAGWTKPEGECWEEPDTVSTGYTSSLNGVDVYSAGFF